VIGLRTVKSNFTYKGPREGIGDLPCERIDDTEYGRVVRSVWLISDEERAAIAAGANIELDIVGEPIPPVSLNVTYEEFAEAQA